GDMVCLIALDFVLRLGLRGVMRVPLIVHVLGMDLDDPAADMPGLGIPGDVIADSESFAHLILPTHRGANRFNGRHRRLSPAGPMATSGLQGNQRGLVALFPRAEMMERNRPSGALCGSACRSAQPMRASI